MARKVNVADAIDAEIIGDKAIARAIQGLAKSSTRRKILRPAIGEAASAVTKAARARVSVETGLLKKSIGNKVITDKRTGTVTGLSGPRHGFKREVTRPSRYAPVHEANPVRYAHLVEFGTAHSAPEAFMRPAMDQTPIERIIRKRAGIEFTRQSKLAAAKGRTLR